MLDFQTEKGAPALFPEKGKKKAFRAARKTRRKLMFYECELSCINFNINFSPRRDPWDLPSSTKYMGPIETDKLNCVCRTGRAQTCAQKYTRTRLFSFLPSRTIGPALWSSWTPTRTGHAISPRSRGFCPISRNYSCYRCGFELVKVIIVSRDLRDLRGYRVLVG